MSASAGTDTQKLAAWAAVNPRIRRVWVLNSNPDIAIEMEPVADSEETIAYWIAHAEQWQAELEKCVGSSVDLEWFDPDVDAPLGDKAVLAYDRFTAPKPPPSSPAAPQPPR